jgi:hypothetical protein
VRGDARLANPVRLHECKRAPWTTAMTGMCEAYPVDQSTRFDGSGWSLFLPFRFAARGSASASTHGWSGCPRGKTVRTWRTDFYRGVDFRSKSAQRQLTKIANINEIFQNWPIYKKIWIDF